jgi:spermidine synthase
MVHLAVFTVSFSTLAFEVLLARLFAFSQWHHLSFMVISIALLGFGASGSFLSLRDLTRWSQSAGSSLFLSVAAASLLCSGSILIAFLGLIHLPLDYFRLVLEPIQIFYLLTAYLLLILPFFFAGGVIALAYIGLPQRPGPVYFASMTGSALGAMAPVVLLPLVGEQAVVGLSALLPAVAVLAGRPTLPSRKNGGKRWARLGRICVLGSVCVGSAGFWLLTPAARDGIEIKSSEYKWLSHVLQFPDTEVIDSISGIRGRIERVRSPHLRFAPGLSLKYTESLPAAEAVFIDRDQPLFLYPSRPAEGFDFARFTLSFAAYEIVGAPDRVLLIMDAGGLAVACARASDARHVRVVQPDPHLADTIQQHYGLEVIREAPRSLLARSEETFDVIHIEHWGSSLPGADALNQDHLLTVDGLKECLRHLSPQGVLVVSHKLLLPPSTTLRLWSTVREALSDCGMSDPERGIAMLRNWDTFTLLAARHPLPNPNRILKFARRLNFDVVYLDGAVESDANRFNVFDRPYHFHEIQRMENAFRMGKAEDFFSEYLLDIEPRTDLQPFPGHFLKWGRLGDLYRTLGGRPHSFFLAGEVVVVIVFLQALAVAVVLLLIPAVVMAKKTGTDRLVSSAYFGGIGAGYIFAELLFIYAGTLFFGDPVVSLAVALTTLLVSSGAGGLWAQRYGPGSLTPALLTAATTLLVTGLSLWYFSEPLLALPEFWRYAVLSAAVMIPGFAMGVPFPLGMRFLMRRPEDRAFAWAANGCASILASIAAAQIAVSAGLHWILAAALIGYALACWGILKANGTMAEQQVRGSHCGR